jgi:ABC-type dipeptide/oligopeptide/nickel transport system permease component
MEEITYLTDEQLEKKKKRAKIFDKITTGLLIFLLTTPVLVLGYIFLWFGLR